jgi:hypothetical protein
MQFKNFRQSLMHETKYKFYLNKPNKTLVLIMVKMDLDLKLNL